MTKVIKTLQVLEYDNGSFKVLSTDKRQMARWYALDYLTDKAKVTTNGSYIADVSLDYYFSGGFRKRIK